MAMPVQDVVGGKGQGGGDLITNKTLFSFVCSDLLLASSPWAAPIDGEGAEEGWQAAPESQDINERFRELVSAEFPQVFVYVYVHMCVYTNIQVYRLCMRMPLPLLKG